MNRFFRLQHLSSISSEQALRSVLMAATLLCTSHPEVLALTKTVCPSGCDYMTITEAVASITFPLTQTTTIEVGAGTYRERVQLNNKDGTASYRFTIKAVGTPGTAVIDGSDAFQWDPVNGFGNSVWSTYIYPTPWNPPATQVFVDSVRYNYNDAGAPEALSPGEYTYDSGAPDWVYINTGGGFDPNDHDTGITNTSSSRQRAFEVEDTEYLTLEGLTVRRCAEEGIRIRGVGGTIHSVIVKNCTATQNFKRGIHVQNCDGCSIEGSRASVNGSHGIYLYACTNGQIVDNHSYRNDDPVASWGGVAGIKVGDSTDSSNVSVVTVARNICHDNEDSGVDLKGAKRILVRGNLSYRNGDHGFDNNYTKHTVFESNVAVKNNHDGLSIESTSRNVEMYNCILALNGVNPFTLALPGYVSEIAAYDTSGFRSDYNVIDEAPSTDWVVGTAHYYRRAVEFPAFRRWATFEGYVDSTVGLDDHSKSSAPAFADSAKGRFRPWWASSAIDAADTTAAGWSATDISGVGRHDCSGKANTGYPAGAAGDIGPYEYDDGMSPIEAVFNYNTIDITWAGYGRYGDANWKPVWYKIYVDDVLKLTRVASGMTWPDDISESVSVSTCHAHAVYVKVLAESLDASHVDIAQSNTVNGETCCQPGCYGGAGARAAVTRDGEVDLPLVLGWAGRNPAVGGGAVKWSIPRAQAGATYDLSLFDVAGRRVLNISGGTAKAGRFTEEMSFRSVDGTALPNGVFYLRLRVGRETLNRALVLAR